MKTRELKGPWTTAFVCAKGCPTMATRDYRGFTQYYTRESVCADCGSPVTRTVGRAVRVQEKLNFLCWWRTKHQYFQSKGEETSAGQDIDFDKWAIDPGLSADHTTFLYPKHWNEKLEDWPSLCGLQAENHYQYYLQDYLDDPEPPSPLAVKK